MVSCISEATANINEYKKFHDVFNVRCLKLHFKLHTEQSEISAVELLLALSGLSGPYTRIEGLINHTLYGYSGRVGRDLGFTTACVLGRRD